MPDALYIPGAPSLGRPLKDNLSDPRCSAQHRPLPHRAPPGRSASTVAPVNSQNSRRSSLNRGSASAVPLPSDVADVHVGGGTRIHEGQSVGRYARIGIYCEIRKTETTVDDHGRHAEG